MPNEPLSNKDERLEQLCDLAQTRWPAPDREPIAAFIEQFYRRTAAEDLHSTATEDLYGAAVSHWQLLQAYRNQALIRVYHPDPEQHGWQSSHTVIEIVVEDRPFLIDSVTIALNRRGLTIHLIIHPVIPVDDSSPPQLSSEAEAERRLACMHFEVDRHTDAEFLQSLQQELAAVLEDVRLAVNDWQAMRERLEAVRRELQQTPSAVAAAERDEALALLQWLAEDNFTFLGYRCYELERQADQDVLRQVSDTGLGILRQRKGSEISARFAKLPEVVQRLARSPEPLIVTKSNARATVHRPAHMDYIGIKRFDADGRVIGEHRFLGLYTSAAYNRNPRSIPVLRRKIAYVIDKAGLRLDSHDGKALLHILETYPRDELFQIDPDTLYRFSLGVLQLQERRRLKIFVRHDVFHRFVSCLIFAPRERYNTEVREQMQQVLMEVFGGDYTEFAVHLTESVLARIHIVVFLREPGQPAFDQAALEARLSATMQHWRDGYYIALLEQFGEALGTRLFNRYREAFDAGYREDVPPRLAAHDTARLEALGPDKPLAISLYRPLEAAPDFLRLKLFHSDHPIALSDALPLLENMGLRVIDERPYDVHPDRETVRWVHDFGMQHPRADSLDQIRDSFEDALAAVWHGRAEDDGFNRLVLTAGLDWRRIVILRAYCKYLRQAGTTLSQGYIEDTLASHPRIAQWLVELFHAHLAPDHADPARADQLTDQIEAALDEVTSLDQDRILRRYLAAIKATLRTNFFQTAETGPKPYLSLKLAPAEIPAMPEPHPAYEIFVYARDFEGTHLRGGKVARGGIRWSDRREDFRTEVLGLMKAQMVKNAVIVPVGAKGGFVLKHPPGDREALSEAVRDCYANFIRGLLDITDNRTEGGITRPPRTVCHDDEDPYLVVAADKGTARFSDLANAVAAEYGFWLGDAFASGGSAGYDHKAMGITARGAWEAVRRHFRELGKDIQSEAFTVVGIGDMSGDVFGNGMLLSRHIKLIAAFDHRHVFIDPDPDPEISYQERQRLFAKPRSSWDDYDRAKLSTGGEIYPRTAKRIRLSPEARRALDVQEQELSPNALIRAVLRAPVELLWNGGIGTYVKASYESHAEVGDKGNDAVRVDGRTLRARVVGEGGNLGFTQQGRIEYALRGGRINTDAIDNSGGVDCSDHEVNIKILLNEAIDNGDLTLKQRNQLLEAMREEVARLVLSNNYHQTQAISLTEARALELLDEHTRLIRHLERNGLLDRALENLPDDEALAERSADKRGLTRPELAVLLAYAKIALYGELLDDPVLDEPRVTEQLLDYFPAPIAEGYAEAVRQHRLRDALAATVLTNEIVDRMGPGFARRVADRTSAGSGDVARAYIAAREILGLGALRADLEPLDNRIEAAVQGRILNEIARLHEDAALWLLRECRDGIAVDQVVEQLQPCVEQLGKALPTLLPESGRQRLEDGSRQLMEQGLPETLAARVAALRLSYTALDIAAIRNRAGCDMELAAQVYYCAAEKLGISWLRKALEHYVVADHWQERLRDSLLDELYLQLRDVGSAVLRATSHGEPAARRVDAWIARNANFAERSEQTLSELRSAGTLELPMLAMAVQELKRLAQAGAAPALEEDMS